jgi:V/A-type H+-transporting ATPase subunit D
MAAPHRVNATRMELTRLKKRLAIAVRGHKLLKDKRDEMIRRFVVLARENKAMRERVEERLRQALNNFVLARAVMDDEAMDQALMAPSAQAELALSRRNIMSVLVPAITVKSIDRAQGGVPYGYAFTTGELDGAIRTMAALLPELIALAETEKACAMLADEIEKTRRRVNALEYVLIPQMESDIRTIKMKLDENERGNLTRLMKTKEMIQARNA